MHADSRLQGHSLGMEKLKIGLEMSTRCTDPPMMLMGIIPYGVFPSLSAATRSLLVVQPLPRRLDGLKGWTSRAAKARLCVDPI